MIRIISKTVALALGFLLVKGVNYIQVEFFIWTGAETIGLWRFYYWGFCCC